jgi:hypothetical protein
VDDPNGLVATPNDRSMPKHRQSKQSQCRAREPHFPQLVLADLQVIQALPEGRNVITAPTMVLPMPPSSSHRVLFVGAPVKIREMPEPAESDAFIP